MGNIFSDSSNIEDIDGEILDENEVSTKKVRQSKVQLEEYAEPSKNKTKRRKINIKTKSKANRRY
jgi:hypothetical protein